jgi:hypothetical protein
MLCGRLRRKKDIMKTSEPISNFIFDYKVDCFLEFGDSVIVLFDYMDFPKNEQAKNLRCYNNKKELLWIAEHPTNETIDCYTSISLSKDGKLVAYNFACYNCLIDPITGKLIKYIFTK